MTPLFETILDYIPAPEGDPEAPTQVLISTIDYNEYVGRIGIGKIVKIKEEELNYTKQSIEDTEAEKKRLSDAIEVFIEKTQKMVESMKVTAGEQEAEILEGHIMMIQDPAISEQIEAKIDGEKINAEAAVEEACDFFAQIFAMADDELCGSGLFPF